VSASSASWLVAYVVHLPRDVDDVGNLPLDRLELGIEEPLAEPAFELFAGELHVTLTLSHLDSHAK